MAQGEPASEAGTGLSARDQQILDFERRWWQHVGAKEEEIRSQFALSAARYYQVLNALIDSPAAVRYDPMLVKRLQRTRDARAEARAARAFRRSDHGGPRAHDEESNY